MAGFPGLVSMLAIASLVVIATPRLRGTWPKVVGAAAIAGVLIFVVRPLVSCAFAPVLKAAAHLDHTVVYHFPTDGKCLSRPT